MTALTISPHMRCVGACSHCGVESTRKDTRTLPDEVVRRLVDEACTTPEIELVSFYGGEPMLRADFILELCAKLTEHGKPTLIYTNGFWGVTEAKALRMLERLRDAGVGTIVTSADNFHSEYISLERVKNVLRAHRHVPEVAITVTTVESRSNPAEPIREELGDLLDDVTYIVQGVLEIGNARNLPDDEFTKPYTTFDELACPEVGLNFTGLGTVTPCPALESIIQLPGNHPMARVVSLGNSETQTVKGALEAMEQPIVQVLNDHGPSWFVSKFREAGIPRIPRAAPSRRPVPALRASVPQSRPLREDRKRAERLRAQKQAPAEAH